MLKNYLRIAIRHLNRRRFFSAIHILCLSAGICFSLVIGIYIWTQVSVNRNLADVDRQYYLKSEYKQKDLGLDLVTVSALARQAKVDYPALIENYYRFNPVTNVISAGDLHFREDAAIGDTTLVSMYDLPLLYGDKHRAFENNSSAVITESMAKKLYGTTNAIGRVVSLQSLQANVRQDYKVTAVIKQLPKNSVTNFMGSDYGLFVPTEGSRYFSNNDVAEVWDQTNEVSFLKLRPNVDPKKVKPLLDGLIRKNSPEFISKNLAVSMNPLKDYYLKDNNGAIQKMILILTLIAAFVLVMVIINFVNINIGTSAYRLKEIGLRKTFGGQRKQLVAQFIIEAVVLTFIAALLGLLLYQLLLPAFSKALNTILPACWAFGAWQWAGLAVLVLLVGFLAGVYPAFILSATNLVKAVKGKPDSHAFAGVTLKRGLLLLQFSLATLVFICTLNVRKQVNYIFNKDLGYNRDQLMVITAFPKQWDSAGVARMETIKKGLLELSEVKSGVLCFDIPDATPFGRIVCYPPGVTDKSRSVNLPLSQADEDYAKTLGVPMVAGTFFGEQNKQGTVLNETAVRLLGLDPAKAVGQTVQTLAGGTPFTITGVIKDFHFSSLQDKIGPLGFVCTSSSLAYRFMMVRVQGNHMAKAIDDIKAKWKSFAPNAPFDYTFMDQKFAKLYQAELQLRAAADIATGLNLFIVLIGIIGVVAFMLAKRNKEIAVRRVLGATASNIVSLFLKEYAILLVLANAIGWPLAYIFSEKLLQSFAYRIQQDALTYLSVLGVLLVLSVALITAQCFKAATANPSEKLRSE